MSFLFFLKQAISFPVHSMGWIDVDEDKLINDILAETVNECIGSLAEQRKDLWAISETWGDVCMVTLTFHHIMLHQAALYYTSDSIKLH